MKLGKLPGADGLSTIGVLILCFCALDVVHTYIGGVGEGLHLSWQYLLLGVPEFWITYFAAMPIAIALAGRYPLDLRRPRTLLFHILGALVFAYVHILLVACAPFITLRPDLAFAPRLFRVMRLNFSSDFLTYFAVIGAAYIARHYSALHQQQVSQARLEATLVQAQLQALQAQLRPHFFFNTLQAISVLALKGDRDGVVETIAHLGNLVRIACDSKRPQKVTLAAELAFLDEYFAIQQLSLGDRLRITRTIAPDALQALIPSMLLQPLVENAIVHGVASREAGGTVTLDARRFETMLRVSVADSGRGFGGSQHSDGVGLANTRARLHRIYGDRFDMQFGEAAAGGACVSIAIPYEPAGATVMPGTSEALIA